MHDRNLLAKNLVLTACIIYTTIKCSFLMEEKMVKIKQEKLLKILKENADKDGVVKNPANFWEEAGCKNKASAQTMLSFLKQKGHIKPLKFGVWQIQKTTKEGIKEEITLPTKADILFLTPQGKTVFDWLGNLKKERFGKEELTFEDENEKEEFIKRMRDEGVLRDTLGNGTKGRIYELNIEKWLLASEKIKINLLPAIQENLKNLKNQIKLIEEIEKKSVRKKVKKMKQRKKSKNWKIT
jgi:hypothetical protein